MWNRTTAHPFLDRIGSRSARRWLGCCFAGGFATPSSERFDQAETDGAIITGSEVIQVLKRLDQD